MRRRLLAAGVVGAAVMLFANVAPAESVLQPPLTLAAGDTIAVTAGSNGSLVLTVTPAATPAPPPSPAPTVAPTAVPTAVPTPAPTAAAGPMIVGLDIGKWGGIGAEVKVAADYVRMDTPTASSIAPYAAAGLGVVDDIVGPYNTGGVAALDPVAWANNAVALYRAAPGIVAIEILNEPGATWFWGSGALSQTNATAYAKLLKTVRAAFAPLATKPLLLGSFDGGYASGSTWGAMVKTGDPLAWTYVDAVTVHHYGGTGSSANLGNRSAVMGANTATGRPVFVTEVGWPTAVGQPATGDSRQWTEAEQATNIHDFIAWARGTGYVSGVSIFNYRDFGTNNWYGITRTNGTHKPSFGALR